MDVIVSSMTPLPYGRLNVMNDNNLLYHIIFPCNYSQKLHIINTPKLRRELLDDLIKLILHKVQPPESAPAIE